MKNTDIYTIPDEDKNTVFEKTNKFSGKLANFLLIILVFISIFIAYISTVEAIYQQYVYSLFFCDFLISLIFAGEYFYRWTHSHDKASFPFHFLNILDLCSFLPFFLLVAFFGTGVYGIFAIFRIFRIFRIIELFEKFPMSKIFFQWVSKHKLEIITWSFIIIFVLILFSTLMYLFEYHGGNAQVFPSLPAATWWAIYALTTSWDAGMIPQTLPGKILAGILMSVWPMLISLISSVIVIIFLDATNIINLKKKIVFCKKCESENESDARHCKHCGKKL